MSIKIQSTRKALSNNGGLLLAKKVLKNLGFKEKLTHALPTQKRCRTSSPYEKFEALCLGLVAGNQCLDDLERLADDPAFSKIVKNVNSAQTYGDFLRSFSFKNIQKMNHILIESSLNLRNILHPTEKNFILDLDSTQHKQYGKKIEGLDYNYDHEFGLSSLEAFDQYGFQYWFDVREGNAHTSVGSAEAINTIFNSVTKNNSQIKKILRADSGYCDIDIMNICFMQKSDFVITMKKNMYKKSLQKVENWKESNLKFYNGNPCFIGSTIYENDRSAGKIRIIFIRSEKSGKSESQKCNLLEFKDYEYYAWATNIENNVMTIEEIINFYRKRGNAENFIREIKNGLDLKHFPCQKLLANKFYAIIGAFANNILRFLSHVNKPKNLHFSKLIRHKIIFMPVQVILHARQTIFRFSQEQYSKIMSHFSKIQDLFKYKIA